ncbi:MAG: hypothetical protein EHM35_00430 [Planctomycetaceae bacterium]|nr:MAG: hypothetical protein EHM35_00430 [Planctomycetaceae bacterium]
MKKLVLFISLLVLLLPGVALAQETGATPPPAESLSIFLQLILESVVALVLVPLALAGVKWLLAKAMQAKASLPAELVYTLEQVAKIAVAAAEQSGLAGHIKDTAEDKKQFALEYAENLLRQQFGLVLNLDKLGAMWWEGVVDALDGAIEADVGERNAAFSPEKRGMVSANDFKAAK